MTATKKLKLKNVTDTIGESRAEWREGDYVIIQSQTGTGKTYYIINELIQYATDYSILFICNRKNLSRQIKIDLLNLYNMEIPDNPEELDNINQIKHVTIKSYQSIQEKILNDIYFKTPYTIKNEYYDYIILDEFHYIFADSSFNNTTRLIYEYFMLNPDIDAIKIFMTATVVEVQHPLIKCIERMREKILGIPYLSGTPRTEFNPKIYISGKDYSYVNPYYFKRIKDIITIIKNDTTDNKWIIFVSNKEKEGEPIKKELGDDAVFITADTPKTNKELHSIIYENKFTKKVLITTKTLDNGININDKNVKNIVIIAWDETSFIQMLGRRRIDIEKADIINLYIPIRTKQSFKFILDMCTKRLEEVTLCKENPKTFARKYDNDSKALSEIENLIYRDFKTKEWTVNPIGEMKLGYDIHYYSRMVNKFETEGKFAFVKEQLSWLNLVHTFDEKKLLINVIPEKEKIELEKYLSSLYNNKVVMLEHQDRYELIKRINVRDKNNKNRQLKSIKALNNKLGEINSKYIIEQFQTSRIISGKKKNFKSAWRITQRK